MPAPKKSKRPPKMRTIGGGDTDGTRGPEPMRPPMIGGGDTEGTRGPKPMRRGDDDVKMFADGGMVRGCKSVQSSGKGFSGTY